MNVVICESFDDAKKVFKYKHIPEDAIVVSLSCVLKPNQFPDRYVTYFYNMPLIPSPTILNLFYAGDVKEYAEAVFDYWYDPPRLIYINEVIYRMCNKLTDLIIVTSFQEEEFMLTKLFKDFIKHVYLIKPVKAKKYIKGEIDIVRDKQAKSLLEFTNKQREKLIQLHDDLNTKIHPTMYARYPKKVLKELPKKYKTITKQLVTMDWKGG